MIMKYRIEATFAKTQYFSFCKMFQIHMPILLKKHSIDI